MQRGSCKQSLDWETSQEAIHASPLYWGDNDLAYNRCVYRGRCQCCTCPHHTTCEVQRAGASADGSWKRKSLHEMVCAVEDAPLKPSGALLQDSSLMGSSKRTRTSHGGCFSASHDNTSVAGGASAYTGLSGEMQLTRLSGTVEAADRAHPHCRSSV
jgi:hypothetical protein